jgi:hypothetical protein
MKRKNPAVSGDTYSGLREERLFVWRFDDDGFACPVATGTTKETLTDAVALLVGEVVWTGAGGCGLTPVPPLPPPPQAARLSASVEIDASVRTLRFIYGGLP